MLKKYIQDVIQTLFKESLTQTQKTKQTSVKGEKFGIRQKKVLIKPETLAIGNKEMHDSQGPAESLRMARIFEAALKKFVNPKLDLMATLEQIRAMELKRRVEVLRSLGTFLKLETRTRLPALSPENSSAKSNAERAPEEISIGWTGQPTVDRITCNVETSSPRGIDDAFLSFAEFENFGKFRPAGSKPLVVRLGKARGRSGKTSRMRKTSLEAVVVPENNENKVIVNVDEPVRISNAVQSAQGVGEQNANECNAETNPSRLEKLGELADANFKHVRAKSREFCLKVKDGMRNTISGFLTRKDANEFGVKQVTPQNEVEIQDFNERGYDRKLPGIRPEARERNVELERVVGGGKLHEDSTGRTDHVLNGNIADAGVVHSNETDQLTKHEYKSARELSDVTNSNAGSSASKNVKSGKIKIPKGLVSNSPGTETEKSRFASGQERSKTENRTKQSPSYLGEVPVKSTFTSIETNNSISNRGENKHEKPLSNVRTRRDGLNEKNIVQKDDGKETKKDESYTLENKATINDRKNKSINAKYLKFVSRKTDLNEELSAEKIATRETKSKSNLHPVRTSRRLSSKSSLKKVKNNKLTSQSDYLKRKDWLKESYEKPGKRDKSNVRKRSSIKIQENFKDELKKTLNFKAGNYTPRLKHFPKEKFPSLERLNLSKRKASKVPLSKPSLQLHDGVKNKVEYYTDELKKESNIATSSAGPRRPRTALTVRGKKRTKVMSISIPSVEMFRKMSGPFKEALKKGLNTSRKKMSGDTSLKSSETIPYKKESTETLVKNKSYSNTKNNPTDKNNLSQSDIVKTKAVKRPQYKIGKRAKNAVVNQSNAEKGALKARKARKLPPKKPESKFDLRMYGLVKAGASVNNPAPEMQQNNELVKKVKLENQSGLPTNNRITKNKHLKKTSPAKVSNSLPVINVHRRSFSTIYNNTLQRQRKKSVSAETSRSMPVVINNEANKLNNTTKLIDTNLGTKIRCNSSIPTAKKIIPMNDEYLKLKSLIAIKDGVNPQKFFQNVSLAPGLATSERSKKVKRMTRKRSLERKRNNIVIFKKGQQESTSRTSANSSSKKELNVEVLYNSSDSKAIGSDTNINLPSMTTTMSSNILKNKDMACSSQVNNAKIIPPQMIQNVVDKCVNRVNLKPFKVMVSPSTKIFENHKPRRWKSKVHRLNALQLYKRQNSVRNLNLQLAKTIANTNVSEMKEKLSHSKPENKVYELNANMERLISKINKSYKFPMHPQTDHIGSFYSTMEDKSAVDNLGQCEKQMGPGKTRQSRKGAIESNGDDSEIKNECNNRKISREVDINDKHSKILLGAKGKINLARLHLDELVKSKVSKSLSSKDLTYDKFMKQIKSETNKNGANDDTFLKGRNDRHQLSNFIERIASSKDKLVLDKDVNTILVNLVANAKKAKSSKSKSPLQSTDVKYKPVTVKNLLEDLKPLKSVMKYYKPEKSMKKERSYVAKSVNNKNRHTNIYSKRKELPNNINDLVGIKKVKNVKNAKENAKPVIIDKNLSQLSKIMTEKQITDITHIKSKQVLSTNDKKTEKLPRYASKTTLTKRNLTHSLEASKPYDNRVKLNHSKVKSKINSVGGNDVFVKNKSDESLNKSNGSFTTFNEFLMLSKDKNKRQGHFLRSTGTLKKQFTKYDDKSSIKNKILRGNPTHYCKETLKATDNIISNYRTPEKQENEAKQKMLKFKNKINKITEEACTTLVKKKSATSHALKYTEGNNFLERFVLEKPSQILKSGLKEPQLSLINKSSDKSSNDVKILNSMEIAKSLSSPNISKDIVMKSHTSNIQSESSECRETRSTNNKKIAIEISTSILKNLVTANGIKQKEITASTSVKSDKATEITPVIQSNFLKSQEEGKKDNDIPTRLHKELVSFFPKPALKLEPTKKLLDKSTCEKEPVASERKSDDVKIHNQQSVQQNCENAVIQESKLTRKKTFTENKAAKQYDKVGTQENVTRCHTNVNTATGSDGNLFLQPGFI